MEIVKIFAIASAACEAWHHLKPILMGLVGVLTGAPEVGG